MESGAKKCLLTVLAACLCCSALTACDGEYSCGDADVHQTVYKIVKGNQLLLPLLMSTDRTQTNLLARISVSNWLGRTLASAGWKDQEEKLRARLAELKAEPTQVGSASINDAHSQQAAKEHEIKQIEQQLAEKHDDVSDPAQLVHVEFESVNEIGKSNGGNGVACKGLLRVKTLGVNPMDLGTAAIHFTVAPNEIKRGEYTVEVELP